MTIDEVSVYIKELHDQTDEKRTRLRHHLRSALLYIERAKVELKQK